jgi:hypothetical protein
MCEVEKGATEVNLEDSICLEEVKAHQIYKERLVEKAFVSLKHEVEPELTQDLRAEFLKKAAFSMLKSNREDLISKAELANEIFYMERIRKLFDAVLEFKTRKRISESLKHRADQHYFTRLAKIGIYAFRKHFIKAIMFNQVSQMVNYKIVHSAWAHWKQESLSVAAESMESTKIVKVNPYKRKNSKKTDQH